MFPFIHSANIYSILECQALILSDVDAKMRKHRIVYCRDGEQISGCQGTETRARGCMPLERGDTREFLCENGTVLSPKLDKKQRSTNFFLKGHSINILRKLCLEKQSILARHCLSYRWFALKNLKDFYSYDRTSRSEPTTLGWSWMPWQQSRGICKSKKNMEEKEKRETRKRVTPNAQQRRTLNTLTQQEKQ